MNMWGVALLPLLTVPLGAAAPVAPVVVELFGSQGCSSCPPADALLDVLYKRYGSRLIPLSCHVDYWDHLGWKDPYALSACTERQEEYRSAFHESNVYTPQMVVQGTTGFLGSDPRRAESAIAKAFNKDRARFQLEQTALSDRDVALKTKLPHEIADQVDRLTVIVFENTPDMLVEKGENAHRRLTAHFSVRKIFSLPPATMGHYEFTIPIDATWNRTQTGVAVLVQDSHRQIIAAESLFPLEDKRHARM
jgi:hypothetical protein